MNQYTALGEDRSRDAITQTEREPPVDFTPTQGRYLSFIHASIYERVSLTSSPYHLSRQDQARSHMACHIHHRISHPGGRDSTSPSLGRTSSLGVRPRSPNAGLVAPRGWNLRRRTRPRGPRRTDIGSVLPKRIRHVEYLDDTTGSNAARSKFSLSWSHCLPVSSACRMRSRSPAVGGMYRSERDITEFPKSGARRLVVPKKNVHRYGVFCK